MIRYYLHGLEVPREGAFRAWRKSKTYRRAAFKDQIWPKAENEVARGKLSAVLRNHLAEVGLSMCLRENEPTADLDAMYQVTPRLMERECGGWLAVTPKGWPLSIGVTGDTKEAALDNFTAALERWASTRDMPDSRMTSDGGPRGGLTPTPTERGDG